MKTKVTKKQIMNNYPSILSLGYCELQQLLNHFSPSYYTCGVYGWNADIYIIDDICIAAGYRPFGNQIERSERTRAEREYEALKDKNLSCDAETQAIKEILKSLVK